MHTRTRTGFFGLKKRRRIDMEIELTNHAMQRLRRRRIDVAWVQQAVAEPEMVVPDADDASLEHRLAIVPEADYRVLRVVCDGGSDPIRIVTAFFDPDMKGKL